MAILGATANGGALDIIYDSEVPRTFTAKAREVISGGQFVAISGAAGVVGSAAALFIPGSIVAILIKDQNYANGIALQNAGSNTNVTIATRGTYIANSADAISGGAAVVPVNGTVQGLEVAPIGISYSGTTIGRAVTAAASGTISPILVDFNFA